MASTRGLGFKNRSFERYFFQRKRYQKPFLDCGSQGCGIISDYESRLIMVNNETDEWIEFRVGRLERWSNSCTQLISISHVSHINNALNIFEDGVIKAGLVFDESRLNKERISVVWLSPNNWDGAGGFRYGNIRFNFDWKKLVTDKNYYWIESIAYGIPACRILVSSNDYSSKFPIYNPKIGNGPWWHRIENDTHYWNGRYCLEIMIERDFSIREASSIDFVTHHNNRCNISPMTCPDRGLYLARAGVQFIAGLIGRGYDFNINNLFKDRNNIIEEIILTQAISMLWQDFDWMNLEYFGDITSTNKMALPISRAVLNCYASKNDKELKQLCSLFKSKEDLKNSCAQLIGNCLYIPNWRILVDPLRRNTTS